MWKPIETAPRNGDIMVMHCAKHGTIFIGWRDDDHWQGQNDFHCAAEPTHWLPLPAPPEHVDE